MNFDAGRVRSMTAPSAVKVMTPVATSARNVDWSAWLPPGVCPGGLPEAAPQTQPSMIGWIVAEAADALLRKSAAATNIARTKRLMVTPLRERDTQPHSAARSLYIRCSRICWLIKILGCRSSAWAGVSTRGGRFHRSGGTRAAKTTLLATLLALVPPDERIVIVEDSRELAPNHPHVVRIDRRPATLSSPGRSPSDL